ncbi:MAG TPA: competence/damage-inducible protein A [Gemmatimonadales bacterium]|nr:competence/damage-inducible protein A [Gemmatimonadales bacterium]
MDLELITVGTELLLGHTVDTNGAELGRALAAAGIRVVRRTSIPDEEAAIRDAVAEALRRSGAVLTTGGLGPTRDDVTKKVVAELFGAPLQFDEAIWERLLERFRRLGRPPAPSNRSQAEVPRGATVLPNRWGTAPGLWLEGAPGLAILLPGVPTEMRNLLHHEVLPRLAARGGGRVVRSRVVRTTGIAESALAERLAGVEPLVAPLSLAYLPGLAGVDLRLTAWRLPPDEAERRLDAAAALLRERGGEFVYGADDDDLAALVLAEARRRGWKLAVAESCTGGLLGGRITAVPGSSDVFVGGVIAYDNRVKLDELEVGAAVLAAHGAVSEPVALAMARGVARRYRTELALAITGVAGPAGGTPEKPVGTVWYAAAMEDTAVARRYVFPGTRDEVRARAAQAALFLLYRLLRGGASG